MNVDALIAALRSIYIWIPYSSPVPKNKLAQLIAQLGGQPPDETETTKLMRQQYQD